MRVGRRLRRHVTHVPRGDTHQRRGRRPSPPVSSVPPVVSVTRVAPAMAWWHARRARRGSSTRIWKDHRTVNRCPVTLGNMEVLPVTRHRSQHVMIAPVGGSRRTRALVRRRTATPAPSADSVTLTKRVLPPSLIASRAPPVRKASRTGRRASRPAVRTVSWARTFRTVRGRRVASQTCAREVSTRSLGHCSQARKRTATIAPRGRTVGRAA